MARYLLVLRWQQVNHKEVTICEASLGILDFEKCTFSERPEYRGWVYTPDGVKEAEIRVSFHGMGDASDCYVSMVRFDGNETMVINFKTILDEIPRVLLRANELAPLKRMEADQLERQRQAEKQAMMGQLYGSAMSAQSGLANAQANISAATLEQQMRAAQQQLEPYRSELERRMQQHALDAQRYLVPVSNKFKPFK